MRLRGSAYGDEDDDEEMEVKGKCEEPVKGDSLKTKAEDEDERMLDLGEPDAEYEDEGPSSTNSEFESSEE